jgi:hypothetical protein
LKPPIAKKWTQQLKMVSGGCRAEIARTYVTAMGPPKAGPIAESKQASTAPEGAGDGVTPAGFFSGAYQRDHAMFKPD